MQQQHPTPPDEQDGPTLEDLFPEGDRVIVTHSFSSTKRLATGIVVGYEDGLVDTGTPESGPGPLAEETLIVVACDDGRLRSVDPGNLEPEDVVR
jgi:hypothetical protein